jgi:hypothetical protein
VDIQGAAGSNYNIGWTEAGEWVEYTVNVTQHAEYNITFTIATPYDGKIIHLEQNGVNITGPIAVPNTGGFQNWQTVTVSGIHLHEDISELRVHFEANDINFDYIDFAIMTETDHEPEEPEEPQQPAQSFVLQAEDAVVHGATIANNQGGYKGTGFVDYVNATGDYIEWTVNMTAAGSAALYFDYALLGGNRPLEVIVNNTSVGVYDFPATGSWAVWSAVSATASLNAGSNSVKLLARGSSGPNVDQLRVEAGSQTTITVSSAAVTGSDTKILAYPNPSSGHYSLSANVSWQVLNLFGETVASGYGHEIDITQKAAGVYIIRVNGRREKIKVIKH